MKSPGNHKYSAIRIALAAGAVFMALVFFAPHASAASSVTSITNTTNQLRNPQFWAGDSYLLRLTGAAPLSDVHLAVQNSVGNNLQADGQYPVVGTTDGSGNWSISGAFTPANVDYNYREWAVVAGVSSNQITFSVVNPPPPSGWISANPNPCILGTGGTSSDTCGTQLSWSTTQLFPAGYRGAVYANTGQLVSCANSYSGFPINYVDQAGYTFTFYQVASCDPNGPPPGTQPIASVTVAGNSATPSVTITLSPFKETFLTTDTATLIVTSNQPNKPLRVCATRLYTDGESSQGCIDTSTDASGSWSAPIDFRNSNGACSGTLPSGNRVTNCLGGWTEWASVGGASNNIQFRVAATTPSFSYINTTTSTRNGVPWDTDGWRLANSNGSGMPNQPITLCANITSPTGLSWSGNCYGVGGVGGSPSSQTDGSGNWSGTGSFNSTGGPCMGGAGNLGPTNSCVGNWTEWTEVGDMQWPCGTSISPSGYCFISGTGISSANSASFSVIPRPCQPPSQTITPGSASFQGTNASGISYGWSAPQGSPSSGGNVQTFNTNFSTVGSYIVNLVSTVTGAPASTGFNSSCSVTVGNPPPVSCTPSVSIYTYTPTISVGVTAQFYASYTDSSCGSTVVTQSASWSSSNPTVATQTATPGQFQGNSPGTTNISADYSGLHSNVVPLTVITNQDFSLSVCPSSQTVNDAGGGGIPSSCTPAPSCTFSASPSSITTGSQSTLSWSCSNASSCSIDQNIGSVSSTSGSKTVSPAQTTIYNLSCSGAGGTSSKSAQVSVSAAATTYFYQYVEQPPSGGNYAVGSSCSAVAGTHSNTISLSASSPQNTNPMWWNYPPTTTSQPYILMGMRVATTTDEGTYPNTPTNFGLQWRPSSFDNPVFTVCRGTTSSNLTVIKTFNSMAGSGQLDRMVCAGGSPPAGCWVSHLDQNVH